MNPLCKLFSHNQFLLNIYKTLHAEKSEISIPNCCNYEEKVIFELSCVVLQAEQMSIVRIHTEKKCLSIYVEYHNYPFLLGIFRSKFSSLKTKAFIFVLLIVSFI